MVCSKLCHTWVESSIWSRALLPLGSTSVYNCPSERLLLLVFFPFFCLLNFLLSLSLILGTKGVTCVSLIAGLFEACLKTLLVCTCHLNIKRPTRWGTIKTRIEASCLSDFLVIIYECLIRDGPLEFKWWEEFERDLKLHQTLPASSCSPLISRLQFLPLQWTITFWLNSWQLLLNASHLITKPSFRAGNFI